MRDDGVGTAPADSGSTATATAANRRDNTRAYCDRGVVGLDCSKGAARRLRCADDARRDCDARSVWLDQTQRRSCRGRNADGPCCVRDRHAVRLHEPQQGTGGRGDRYYARGNVNGYTVRLDDSHQRSCCGGSCRRRSTTYATFREVVSPVGSDVQPLIDAKE